MAAARAKFLRWLPRTGALGYCLTVGRGPRGAMGTGGSGPPWPDSPDTTRAPVDVGAPAAARRKVVTVLFCDAVGSTELGERYDPELMQQAMTRYFEAVASVVVQHGGTVEKVIGHAVMAIFGGPAGHWGDALRAGRAPEQTQASGGGL